MTPKACAERARNDRRMASALPYPLSFWLRIAAAIREREAQAARAAGDGQGAA